MYTQSPNRAHILPWFPLLSPPPPAYFLPLPEKKPATSNGASSSSSLLHPHPPCHPLSPSFSVPDFISGASPSLSAAAAPFSTLSHFAAVFSLGSSPNPFSVHDAASLSLSSYDPSSSSAMPDRGPRIGLYYYSSLPSWAPVTSDVNGDPRLTPSLLSSRSLLASSRGSPSPNSLPKRTVLRPMGGLGRRPGRGSRAPGEWQECRRQIRVIEAEENDCMKISFQIYPGRDKRPFLLLYKVATSLNRGVLYTRFGGLK